MPASPMSASPYEVLGVATSASQDDLRKAYRRLLRETHPDTGGDANRFRQLQDAWELVGTEDARARFDRSRVAADGDTWAPRSAPPKDSRPRARSYGHPGGWRRERYLTLVREWAGRGVSLADPYDPAVVRSAPQELRHILADALAEESTARTVSDLGIGYTIWHDVSTGQSDRKIDHIVLGPTGLYAMLSEDFGGPVSVKRGELIGAALAGEQPVRELALRAKVVARQCRVRFTALAIVLPDEALSAPVESLGTVRAAAAVAVRQSALSLLLREGIPGARMVGGNELFDIRTRLQSGIRFV